MAEDWAVTNRETGAVHFVKVPRGRRPSDHGYPANAFSARKLHREPHEDDNFDGKKIERCPVKAAARERRARLSQLGRDELLDEVARMIDERLAELGLIGGDGK